MFEFLQTLVERGIGADRRVKRQLLEILYLNFRLNGVTLVPEMKKPFDVLAEGLLIS